MSAWMWKQQIFCSLSLLQITDDNWSNNFSFFNKLFWGPHSEMHWGDFDEEHKECFYENSIDNVPNYHQILSII